MAKRWIAINVLLIALALLLGWQLRASFLRFLADHDPARIQPAAQGRPEARAQGAVAPEPEGAPRPADFAVIPERTIFSDTRGLEEQQEAASPATLQLQQKPILVGVTIAGDLRRALIFDPGTPAREGRRAESKRIGDVYRGYRITEIEPGHIVLESGARREIIPLHEGSKGTQAGKTPILSTRVVSFGSGGATGGAPITVQAAGAGTPARTAAPAAAPPAPPTRTQTIALPGGIPGRPAAAAPQEPAPTPPQEPASPPGPGGSRVIRTPFGDIVRPDRN
ncbi:MAG: hypothetical protein JXP48_02435 [Acidobacteria bacterium]|nr:hypothetical protein [Acidobacteriota bacterium]